MTYKEAVELRDKNKHLIGQPFKGYSNDPSQNPPISNLVIAPYDGNTAKICTQVCVNGVSNEAAILATTNMNVDFQVFVVRYNSWDGNLLYWKIDKYLNYGK